MQLGTIPDIPEAPSVESGHRGRGIRTLIIDIFEPGWWDVTNRFEQLPVFEPVHPVKGFW